VEAVSKLKGVLFDYGHTLVWFPRYERTHQTAARKAQKVLRKLGASIEASEILGRVQDFAHRRNVLSTEDEFKEIFSSFGIRKYSQHDLNQIIWAWWTPYIKNVRARSGASELLGFLKDMGLKLGIVANIWSEGMNPVLERLNLKKFFSVAVASVDVGFQKPDPRIFHLALDRLGLSPEEAIMVGDNPRADIEPGHDLGMCTVRLLRGPNRTNPAVVKANFEIKNLSELKDIVLKYGQ
jgi:putative hydrolase of the HAD superfamily